jgi:uncharacterized membrane protein
MAFTDDLALVEVLLLLAAVVFTYGGVLSYWAIRSNDPKGLRRVLRSMSLPLAGIGAVATTLALWGEMTWPFPAPGLVGYNIFFFDAMILFGIVVLTFAVSAFLGLRLQYVGLLALVAGGVVAFYGWTGYAARPAFTTDPFYTLLLYAGFGAAAIFAFPATVIVDYYLGSTDALRAPFMSVRQGTPSGLRHLGIRGAQPIVPGGAAPTPDPDELGAETRYHVPRWVQGLVLLFPVVMGLAAISAFWYFGVTLPAHLGAGAGAAP